jgi:general secretion pathway protein A
MYLKHYRLRESPFNITPDPSFLYRSPSHDEALAAVTYGVDKRKGFIIITGEVGSGKTTILRAFLDAADPEQTHAVYVLNPELSFEELVGMVFRELSLPDPPSGLTAAVEELQRRLIEIYEHGRRVVVVIDEAQRVPVETLERLRVFSNLETSKEKLLQIVLCGQPEFDQLLERPELRQLRQRVALRATIQLLTRQQSRAYVEHRLSCVGSSASSVFTAAALRCIIRHARGNPRVINTLCDNALIAGYAAHERPTTAKTVRAVAADLDRMPRNAGWRRAVAGGALACVFVAVWAVYHARMATGSFDHVGNESTPSDRGALLSTLRPASPQAVQAESGAGIGGESFSVPDVEPALDQERELVGDTQPSPMPEARPEAAVDGGSPANAGEVSPASVDVSSLPLPLRSATIMDDPDYEFDRTLPDDGEEQEMTAPRQRDEPPMTVMVRKGDTLGQLVRQVYGKATPDLVKRVLEFNPHVRDADSIYSGDTLMMPKPDEGMRGVPDVQAIDTAHVSGS